MSQLPRSPSAAVSEDWPGGGEGGQAWAAATHSPLPTTSYLPDLEQREEREEGYQVPKMLYKKGDERK